MQFTKRRNNLIQKNKIAKNWGRHPKFTEGVVQYGK